MRWAVRLVAGFAGQTIGVVRGTTWGKPLGLAALAAWQRDAENGCIQLWRVAPTRIVGVLGQRPMTGLAVHLRVLAALLHCRDVGVAGLASLMAREVDWTSGNLGDGVSAIVTVLSKALRNKVSRVCPEMSTSRQHKSAADRKRCPESLKTLMPARFLPRDCARGFAASSEDTTIPNAIDGCMCAVSRSFGHAIERGTK